ncbi:MAG: transcription antitermination protein NusB [Bacteroidales bacterium]|jgi:N utilization substance protein B|nr:transcription antitermination protein NusB [Bacteroidales bacterium]MCI2122269.1 transcription antitermination protein NusB [Bacteroidales bacterium]MCI2144650.1 transcription antitermination protein NusB [Bacteroidales bacterium]
MINRRLIRIKVFKVLFSYMNSGNSSIDGARKDLILSCEKTRDLYCLILNALPAVRRLQEKLIEARMHKFNPTDEERNPNYRFVQNRFILMLEQNEDFNKFCNDKGLVWRGEEGGGDNVFISRLSQSIASSGYYRDYMESPEDTLKKDCELVANILLTEFEDNELFAHIIEEMSLFWIDDVGYVLGIGVKDVEAYPKSGKFAIPEVFTRPEDRNFALGLLQNSFSRYNEYSDLISSNVDNWESDRIVSTDLTLIVMGIAEALTFPEIPVKVTINEYVDISKFYSTPNSRIFVNGLLDKIIRQKIDSGEIRKAKD